MRNFIHKKKDPDAATSESADMTVSAAASDSVDNTDQISSDVLTAEDVETEKLKNAIAQVMAEETAVLPHIEQLSSSVARESGIVDRESLQKNDDGEASGSVSEGKSDKSSEEVSADISADPEDKALQDAPEVPDSQAKISSWFVTFMAMRIPVVGWIYLLYLAFSRKTVNRRNFARAYLLIKLIFLILGLIILLILISTAMNILQDLLDYMEML